MERLFSPAKINCFLYVAGRRKDGYHDIVSLMAPIDLHDEIRVGLGSSGKTTVVCSHQGVPEDDSNLAAKAASMFFKRLRPKGSTPGVQIEIDKRIPVGAGLGGGSSNAAAVLAWLNKVYGHPFSSDRLAEMGAGLGSDVPFFLLGSPALATGTGTTLLKVNVDLPSNVILFYPGIGVSTGAVYKILNLKLTRKRKIDIEALLDIDWENGQVSVLDYMGNDLEPAACTVYPELETAGRRFELASPVPVYLTGSGSCFFALFSDSDQAENFFYRFSKNWKKDGESVYLASVIR
ncbi:MAG: 4-(cytidine 5'-diphospho)-2-C-methyl-D-erythritol kinase [Desulfobacteraceae bacterium]